MSNYDDILRKKEQEFSLNSGLQADHWKAMEDLLNPSSGASITKAGGGKIMNIIKIALLVGGISFIGIWLYKHFAKNQKAFNGILKPSNIKSQFFNINANKDEVIQTSHSSIIRIKAGTFKTDKSVTIEIKEVFTPSEILQSGLTTISDGKPLRSAGMIYFNATSENKTINPEIPINASIPSKQVDKDMQLFKGEMQSDSTVNWISPQTIADTNNPKDPELIAAGRSLYLSKCAACHRTFVNATGPLLKGIQYRGPWKNPANLRKWINNPAAFMATNYYAQELKKQYGSMMTGFPDITDRDISNLVAYLNNTSGEEIRNITMAKDTSNSDYSEKLGGCGEDTTYYSIENNFEEYDTTGFANAFSNSSDSIAIDDTEYSGIYKQGYDFQITDNGWYNVDAFLKVDDNKTQAVTLSAEIVNGESLPYNVYVFVPSERVLQYYSTKKENTYSFNFTNNKIPLPFRYRAIILAFGSSGKKIMYGAAEFTIQTEQHIKIELKETTNEGLLNVLYTNNINGIEIKAIEKQMEIIPRSCTDSLKEGMNRLITK